VRYKLEGQVEQLRFSFDGGRARATLKLFGADHEFVVVNAFVGVDAGSVVQCEVAPLEPGKFQIHHLSVAEKTIYTSSALIVDPADLICSLDDSSVQFRNVLGEISEIELELIAYLRANPHLVREMNSDAFEKLVAEIFASNGYETEWTGRQRDTAADVLAVRRTESLGFNDCYMIECKRYAESNTVGVDVARALYGAVTDERRTGGILVTTSRFESGVYKFANDKWNFEVKDYDDLTGWLQNYLPRRDGKLYTGLTTVRA
tara:strand:+ start:169 stop:951 length:783 start_codon:yes stop_codon:yes gene_type:complete